MNHVAIGACDVGRQLTFGIVAIVFRHAHQREIVAGEQAEGFWIDHVTDFRRARRPSWLSSSTTGLRVLSADFTSRAILRRPKSGSRPRAARNFNVRIRPATLLVAP